MKCPIETFTGSIPSSPLTFAAEMPRLHGPSSAAFTVPAPSSIPTLSRPLWPCLTQCVDNKSMLWLPKRILILHLMFRVQPVGRLGWCVSRSWVLKNSQLTQFESSIHNVGNSEHIKTCGCF